MRPQRKRRRASQAGQVIVIVALIAIVLFGGMALAVDVGLLTNDQKSLQNVTDVSALGGAADIGTQSYQQAVSDALYTVDQNMQTFLPFNSSSRNPNWTSWNGWNKPASQCTNHPSYYCVLTMNAGVTMWVATPPLSLASATEVPIPAGSCLNRNSKTGPNNSAYGALYYLEVDVCERANNNFAGLLGQPTSLVAAHSIAYHFGPAGPSGWALFSNTVIQSGNQAEQVQGDLYYGTQYQAGTSGSSSTNNASLCALLMSNASTEGYGPSPADPTQTISSGHIVVGADAVPPNNTAPSVIWGHPQPRPSYPLASTYQCTSDSTLGKASIAGEACPDQVAGNCLIDQNTGSFCPNGAYWDTNYQATGLCIENPPLSPNSISLPEPSGCTTSTCTNCPSSQYSSCRTGANAPTVTQNWCQNIDPTGKKGALPPAPGVYVIDGNTCSGITIHGGGTSSGGSTDMYCVDFVLTHDASVTMTGGNVTWTSFGSKYEGASVPTPTGNGSGGNCAGSVDFSNDSAFYASSTDTSTASGECTISGSNGIVGSGGCLTISGSGSGCCPVTTIAGAAYLPNGWVSIGQNTMLQIGGQAIVSTWQDQSGNHPNVAITYDPSQIPGIIEVNRLVE